MSKFIAFIAESYIGSFIELDKENFNVSLFTETRIQNVAVKPDLLSQFVDSPIYGHVETISINPNFGNTDPITVTIDGIYVALLLTNADLSKSIDPVEAKRRRLAANDIQMKRRHGCFDKHFQQQATHKQEQQEQQRQQQQNGNEISTSEKISRKLLKRISVKISNVHIRVETDGACFGITLKSLILGTNRSVSEKDSTTPRNTLRMEGLSIYVDPPNAPGVTCPSKREEFVRYLAETEGTHEYVLRPYSATANLHWPLSLEKSNPPQARYVLSGDLDSLVLRLSKEQYSRIFVSLDSLKRQIGLPPAIREKRPLGTVKEEPLKWFAYAAEAALYQVKDRKRRLTPEFFEERFEAKKKYCKLYKLRLLGKLTRSTSRELEAMEDTLKMEDIVFYRSFAVAELSKKFQNKMKVDLTKSVSPLTKEEIEEFEIVQPPKPPAPTPQSQQKASQQSPVLLQNSSSNNTKFARLFSKFRTSLKTIQKEVSEKTTKEIAEDNDADKEDITLEHAGVKDVPVFKMDLKVQDFEIVLEDKHATEPSPVLTVKTNLGVSLVMPTQSSTVTTVNIDNLYGIGDKGTEFVSYNPSRGASGRTEPFIVLGVTADRGKTVLKARMQPVDILLRGTVVSRIVEYGMPPPQVNVKELGTQVWSYVYTYVLLAQDIEDSDGSDGDGEGKRIKAGPGKALENLQMDIAVDSPSIHALSESAADTVVNVQKIRFSSVDTGSEATKGLELLVEGISLETPGDEKEPRAEIVLPFNVNFVLGLPVLDTKKECDSVCVTGHVGSIQVHGNEDTVKHIMNVSKPFCAMLAPLVVGYVNAVSQNMDEKFAAGGGTLSNDKIEMTPVKFDVHADGMSVTWSSKKSTIAPVTLDVSKGAAFHGGLAHYCFSGEVKLPLLTVLNGRQDDHAPILAVTDICVEIEETAYVSCTVELDTVDVNFDAGSTMGAVSDILSTVQRMAPVVNEDFVKVAEENPVSPAAHSGKANLYSVCLNVKQLKAKAWDKEGEVIFLANSLTTDISHKKKDLIAVTIEFSTTSAKAKGNETSYLTLLDLGSSDPKIKRQSLRLSVTSGDSQAYDVCVGLHHICVNTVGIESAAGLFTRMTRQVKEALSLPEASAGDGGLNKMLFGTGSFPSVRMDVDLSEISVEFVPGYVRNVDFKFYVSKVAYKNTDECPCGKVFVRGVDLFALGSLLNLKQIDIEVVPLLRVSREPEEKLFVEVSAAVSDVVLALTPMLLPGLSFVSIGSIAQLFSTTTDTNPFPSFLVVDVTKASVPHIEVHMLPNKETTSSNSNNDQSTDNLDDVMKVVIEGLSVSGKLIDVKQRIEISGDTLCVVPNNDNYIQGSLVQEYELGKCAVFTIERRIDNDAFRYNIDGTINRVSIAEFNDTFLLQRMVPFANQIKFDFGDLVLPSSCKKDKVPTFVSLKINLNSDVSLDYAGRARLCIRSPLSVAFNLKFHGTVLGYALAVDAKNELFASDYKYNKVLSILGLSLELNTDFESAKNTCLQLVVPQISLGFWPGVLSDIVAPVMKGVLAPSLSSQDRAVVCVSVREPAVVPEFMDMWEVKVDVKKIGVDVRRLANSKDCNIVLNVTELSAEALLEKGKAVSPAILTRAKLKLAKAYTVCDEFTLPFADETSVKARSEDGALVLTATSININVQRSNLAVFYAVFHSIPRIVASIPSFGADAVQDAEPIAVNLSASVPSVSVKWVNCFTCAAEGISAKYNGEEWRVDVKRLTASDEHADKMVDLPILALNESSCDSGEKPSVRVTGRRSSESGSLVVAVDVSIIDMFFTPEIIGTVASDVVWMKNYNDYNYDNNSSNTPSNETIGKDEEAATKKQNEAKVTAKPKSRVELRFNIERISACVYEDHTAEYCLGKFHVSLDHFLLGLANTTSGTDLELFSVAVKDLSVEAGFGCYAINKGGKVQRKDDTIKVVVVACNKIDINLTDGVSSSFYVEADPLSVSVNAELLVPFIENHAKKIKVSFASASTDSKVDKRHFDTKHQNWNIPAQEAELQKQIIEKRFTPIQDNDGDNDAKPSKVMQITTGLKRFLEKKIVVKKINLCGVVVDFFAPTTKSRVNLALFGVKCSLNNTQQRTLQFCLNASTSNEKDSSPLIIPWEVNLMVIDMGYPSVQFTSNNLELSLDSHSLKFLCDVLDCFQASDPESGSCIVSGESEKTQNQRYFTLGEINSARPVRVENLCKCLNASVVLALSPAVETIYQIDVENWGVGVCNEDTVGQGLEVAVPVHETGTGDVMHLIVSHSSSSDNCLRIKSPLVFHNRTSRLLTVCFKPNFSEPKVFGVEPNRPAVYGPPQFSSWSDHFFVGVAHRGSHSTEKLQPFYWNKSATQRSFEQVCVERADSTPNQKKWFYLTVLSLTSARGVPVACGAAAAAVAQAQSPRTVAATAVKPLECFFLPALYIENALPTQIMLDLFDVTSGEFSKVSIDGGRTAGIVEVRRRELIRLSITFTTAILTENTPAANIELSLRYPPLSGSVAEQLQYIRTEVPVKVSCPENPKYDGIFFALLTKEEKFGIWKLRIHAKYLLVNTSGVPLVSPIGSSIPIQSMHGTASLVKFDSEKGLLLKERGAGLMVGLSSAFDKYPIIMTLPRAKCSLGVKVLGSGSSYAGLLKIYIEHLYIIHNNTGESLFLRQPQSEMKERQAEKVLENSCVVPLEYALRTRDHIVSISLDGFSESIPFNVKDFIESTDEFIRLHSVTDRNLFKVLRVEVKKSESTTHINFHNDDGSAPFVLQNFSDTEIEFYQEGWKKYSQSVQPGKQAHFAWDSLAVEEKYLRIKGVLSTKIDLCRDRAEGSFTLNNYQQGPKGVKVIKWYVCVENSATFVRFFTKPRCSDLMAQSPAPDSTPELLASTVVSFAASVPQILIKLNERMVVLKFGNTLLTYELDRIRTQTHNVKFALESVEILSGGKKIFTNKHDPNDIASAAASLTRPFWSYIFGSGSSSASASSSPQKAAKPATGTSTQNFLEFLVRKKFREDPTEVHRFYKIYAKFTPIALTIEEQFVISVIKFIEEAIPSRVLQGDDQSGAAAAPLDPSIAEECSQQQSHESGNENGTAIIIGDLDLPELKITLSCKPADARWKKAMLESSSNKRLMALVDFITRFLGSFSNASIEVSPLRCDRNLLFKNTDRLKEIILKHYGNQVIKKVIESSQGSGLLSTATYFAKVASKLGMFDNIL